MENERLINSEAKLEDFKTEISLRPKTFSEYVGQGKVKQTLSIAIKAAKKRQESLDHVIANEMGTDIKVTSGPAIEKAGDLVSILTRLQKNDVLFIDEIHRLNKISEEVLYSAMEEYRVSWIIDEGLKARSVNLGIQPFTLIGATTENPSFEVIPALLSRSQVYTLNSLSKKDLEKC